MPYGSKADVWSLGCILYEISALKTPFDASTFSGLVIKITRGEFEPLSSSYSADLRGLVSKLLAVDPDDRPDINQVLKYKFLKPYIELVYKEFEINRRDRCKARVEEAKAAIQKMGLEKPDEGIEAHGESIGELIEAKKQALESKLGPEKLLLLYTSMKHSEVSQHEMTSDLKAEIEEILSLESFYYTNN